MTEFPFSWKFFCPLHGSKVNAKIPVSGIKTFDRK
jgi:hypothetical protein